MLFLNKQKREEAKMFHDLTQKVKDSKNIKKVESAYYTIYKPDSIDIAFNVVESFFKFKTRPEIPLLTWIANISKRDYQKSDILCLEI